MQSRKRWSALLAAVGVVLLGCRGATDTTTLAQIVVGTIDAGGTLDGVIAGPTLGAVGQPLQFTVSTFGNSCIAAAGANVEVQASQATVTPYDQEYRSGTCLDYLKAYPRTVTIVFAKPGDGIVRVYGRSLYHAGLISVERSVTVTP